MKQRIALSLLALGLAACSSSAGAFGPEPTFSDMFEWTWRIVSDGQFWLFCFVFAVLMLLTTILGSVINK